MTTRSCYARAAARRGFGRSPVAKGANSVTVSPGGASFATMRGKALASIDDASQQKQYPCRSGRAPTESWPGRWCRRSSPGAARHRQGPGPVSGPRRPATRQQGHGQRGKNSAGNMTIQSEGSGCRAEAVGRAEHGQRRRSRTARCWRSVRGANLVALAADYGGAASSSQVQGGLHQRPAELHRRPESAAGAAGFPSRWCQALTESQLVAQDGPRAGGAASNSADTGGSTTAMGGRSSSSRTTARPAWPTPVNARGAGPERRGAQPGGARARQRQAAAAADPDRARPRRERRAGHAAV